MFHVKHFNDNFIIIMCYVNSSFKGNGCDKLSKFQINMFHVKHLCGLSASVAKHKL